MTDHRVPHDEAADRAIDRAVREIMSAEPSAGFRHRVMRRLAEPMPPRRWTWGHVGFAATALTILLAFAIWLRPAGPGVEPAQLARAPESPAALTPTAPAPPQQRPASRTLAPSTAPRQPATPRPAPAPADRIVRAASLPESESGESVPVAIPEPLTIPALPVMSGIELDRIDIKEIPIPPLPSAGR